MYLVCDFNGVEKSFKRRDGWWHEPDFRKGDQWSRIFSVSHNKIEGAKITNDIQQIVILEEGSPITLQSDSPYVQLYLQSTQTWIAQLYN